MSGAEMIALAIWSWIVASILFTVGFAAVRTIQKARAALREQRFRAAFDRHCSTVPNLLDSRATR